MEHALWGGSSAHRWLHCPLSNLIWSRVEASVYEQVGRTEDNQDAMDRGTAIHTLAQDAYLGLSNDIFSTFDEKIIEYLAQRDTVYVSDERPDFIVDDSMREDALFYLQELNRRFSGVAHQLELRVDCEDLAPSLYPNSVFGTADCVSINYDAKSITIVDLKTGFTKVEAKDNKQLMLYAWGVYKRLQEAQQKEIDTIVLVIVQTQFKEVKEHCISIKTLKTFAMKAKKALAAMEKASNFLVTESEEFKNIPVMIEAGKVIDGLQYFVNAIGDYLCQKPNKEICKYCKIKDYVVCPSLSKLKDAPFKEVLQAKTKKNLEQMKSATPFEQLQQEYSTLESVMLWVKTVETAFHTRLENMSAEEGSKAIYELTPVRSNKYSFTGDSKILFEKIYKHAYDENNIEDVEAMSELYTPTTLKSWAAIRDFAESKGVKEEDIKDMFTQKESNSFKIIKKEVDKSAELFFSED